MLKIKNLSKHYPSFDLKDISFNVERGYITGFIGPNGAGKTTTMKCIMNLVTPDSGSVEFLGKNYFENETELKSRFGFSLNAFDYYPKSKVKTIADVYKRFYKNWDDDIYKSYLKKFNIDESKKICELSTGMKVKLGISLALSHNAELIIFDEPTSGLDPIARDELMYLFQEIISDGQKSVLYSTHITSDLDKCADFIVFINNGKIVLNDTKEDIILNHKLISGKSDDLSEELKNRIIGFKKHAFGFIGLIKTNEIKPTDNFEIAKPNIEDIMIYYNLREETQSC